MGKYNITGLPWSNRLGKDVSSCKTSGDVMDKANLNWNVAKCPLVASMPFNSQQVLTEIDELNGDFSRNGRIYRTQPNAYATYRTDKNIPLGLVKEQYTVIQNRDAFSFFDEAIGDDCIWTNAGSFGYGHKIFVTAKIEIPVEISLNGTKDVISNYLVFSNSHDGSSSITIMFTPIRVICTNCLNAGIDKANSYIRIRHTKSAKTELHKGADILKIAMKKANNAKELYQALYKTKMNDKDVLEYLIKLNLTEEEFANLSFIRSGQERLIHRDYSVLEQTKISMRKVNVIQNMYEYYMDGIGQQEIAGTAWGAYNAVTGFYSNVANLEGVKRMDSLLYGNANNMMQKAIIDAYNFKAA